MAIQEFSSLKEAELTGYTKIVTRDKNGDVLITLEKAATDPERTYGAGSSVEEAEERALASLNAALRMRGVQA